MASLFPALVAYAAQVALVALAAAATGLLNRAARPAVRLAYWRGVALLCLALPLLTSRSGRAAPFVVTGIETAADLVRGDTAAADFARATDTIVWVVMAGIAIRLAWLYAGLLRLSAMRRQAEPASLDEEIEAMRRAVAPAARVSWSERVAQPVTFGVRPATILLPRVFASLDAGARRAVACHELLHVARRDWIWIVAEEHVRALFWYHPAMRWILSRIDLCREQVIDDAVVAHTGARRSYMEALLSFASDGHGAPAVVPSLAFFRKRHLRARLRQLAKEPVMTTRRIGWTAAAVLLVMGAATTAIVRAMPLVLAPEQAATQGREEPAGAQDKGVTPPSPTHVVKPEYTSEAMRAKIAGTVGLSAVVQADGTVRDVTVTRSLDKQYGLDEQAVVAARAWRFRPGRKDGEPVAVRVEMEMEFTLRQQGR
jgi:TonB family protein